MVHDWFFNAIIATVLLGVSMVFYKMPSAKSYSSIVSAFWSNSISLGFAIVYVFYQGLWHTFTVSWYGLTWGIIFGVVMILQKTILKSQNVETNSLFPVNSSLSTIGTILSGVVFLSEDLSAAHIIGIGITLFSVYLFSSSRKGFPLTKEVITISTFIVIGSIVTKYLQKKGATYDSMTNFMVAQYVGAVLTCLVAFPIFEKNRNETFFNRKYLLGSFLIASFSFVGGRFLFTALTTGTLSAVYSITPLYVFVTAFLGWLFFKEQMTFKKVVFMSIGLVGTAIIKYA